MSNLLKGYTTTEAAEGKRVLDMNALVAKRIEFLASASNHGFTAGLGMVEVVDPDECLNPSDEGGIDELPAEGEVSREQLAANVIKAENDAREIMQNAKTNADAILEDARREAERIIQEAQQKLQQDTEAVFEAAKNDGYKRGLADAKAISDEMQRGIEARREELEAQYRERFDNIEPMIVDAVTGIYEHIFHTELASYHDVLSYLIMSTLRNTDSGRQYTIHVSKDDYPSVDVQRKAIQAIVAGTNTSVDIIVDQDVPKYECVIETENGIFDCGLGTQLEELRRRLMLLSYNGRPQE